MRKTMLLILAAGAMSLASASDHGAQALFQAKYGRSSTVNAAGSRTAPAPSNDNGAEARFQAKYGRRSPQAEQSAKLAAAEAENTGLDAPAGCCGSGCC